MPNVLANLFSWADGVKRRASSPLQTIALGLQRGTEDLKEMGRNDDIAYGLNGMKSVLISDAQKKEAAQKAAEFGLNMGMAGATVWHGSPHKFDKFDASKIGTGEGAQAYGHGLYLAESDTVARHYKNAGADPSTFTPVRSIRDPAQMAATVLDRAGGDIRHATAVLTQNMQSGDSVAGAALQMLKQRAALPESKYAGNMYKVDLPDNAIAKMLDWDKPLSQQAPEVRQYLMQHPDVLDELAKREGQRVSLNASHPLRLQKIPSAGVPYDASRMSGNDAMTAIQQRSALGKAGGVEQQLRQAGIPGIRYLDGGSRGAGQGSSNYVVFPGQEDILKILERNGVPTK